MTAKLRKRNPDIVYASDPPLQQKRFPNRRRSSRIRTSTTTPTLAKRQSTLTQVEYGIKRTPSSSELVQSSDEEVQQDQRPKKRKRKSDQSNTLTQMVRDGFSSNRKRPRMGDDGFQIWGGSDGEQSPASSPPNTSSKSARRGKGTFEVWDGGDGEGLPKASPPRKSPRLRRLGDVGMKNQVVEKSPRLEIKDSYSTADAESLKCSSPVAKPQFQTPKKVRFTEIPSSQTPHDAKLSTVRSYQKAVLQRSPLKDRSTNISPIKPSPTKKTAQQIVRSPRPNRDTMMGPSIAQRVPLKDVQKLPEVDSQAPILEIPESSQQPVETSEDDSKPASRRKRYPTDEDSQFDMPSSIPAPPATLPCDETSLESEPPVRKLRRVNTVQDSQPDDPDLMVMDTDATLSEVETEFHADDGEDDEVWEPNTYDPLAAALDRDADRFHQSETQLLLDRVAESQYESQYRPITKTQQQVIEYASDNGEAHLEAAVPDATPSSPQLGHTQHAPVQWQVPRLHVRTATTVPDSVSSDGHSDDLDSPVTQSSPPPLEVEPPPMTFKRAVLSTSLSDDKTQEAFVPPTANPPLQPSSPRIPTSQASTVVPTQATLQRTQYHDPLPASRKPSRQLVEDTLTEDDLTAALSAGLTPYQPQLPKQAQPPTQPPFPSQSSTVVPTQASTTHKTQSTVSKAQPAPPRPQPNNNNYPDTLSSSPMPLPPWSSPSRYHQLETQFSSGGRRGGRQGRTKQFGVLEDFSLPPPPPLSSWRSSGRVANRDEEIVKYSVGEL